MTTMPRIRALAVNRGFSPGEEFKIPVAEMRRAIDLERRYGELRDHVRAMFDEAKSQGLMLGIGHCPGAAEGPLTQKLRQLAYEQPAPALKAVGDASPAS